MNVADCVSVMPLDPTGAGPFVVQLRGPGDVALSMFLDEMRDFVYCGPNESEGTDYPRHMGTLTGLDAKYLQHRFRAVIEAIVKAAVTEALVQQA